MLLLIRLDLQCDHIDELLITFNHVLVAFDKCKNVRNGTVKRLGYILQFRMDNKFESELCLLKTC